MTARPQRHTSLSLGRYLAAATVIVLLAGCSASEAARTAPAAVATRASATVPGAVASGTSAAVPCPTRAPGPTPQATFGEIPFGPGTIAIGVRDRADTVRNDGDRPFKTSTKLMKWEVQFGAWPGDTTVTMLLASRGANGVETIVYQADVDVASLAVHGPGGPMTPMMGSGEGDLAALVGRKAGTYWMRYVNPEGFVVGRGQFELADPLGTGRITLGTRLDPTSHRILDPTSSFKASSQQISWSAEFWKQPGCTALSILLSRRTPLGAGVAESTAFSTDVDVGSPSSLVVSNSADPPSLVDHQVGTYVLEYLNSGTGEKLAVGIFELVK